MCVFIIVQRVVRTSRSLDFSRLLAISVFCRPMLYILQILKEIREEHDRRSDHSTALTQVQLETLVSDTGVGVEAEPELMQVKCTSLHFFVFFFALVTLYPYFSSGGPSSYRCVTGTTSSTVDTAGTTRAGSANGKRKHTIRRKGFVSFLILLFSIFPFYRLTNSPLTKLQIKMKITIHQCKIKNRNLKKLTYQY